MRREKGEIEEGEKKRRRKRKKHNNGYRYKKQAERFFCEDEKIGKGVGEEEEKRWKYKTHIGRQRKTH